LRLGKSARRCENVGVKSALLFDLDGALVDSDAHGLARTVLTNAPRANVNKALAALGLDARLPLCVVGGELERAKPDPPPYVTALKRLGADDAAALIGAGAAIAVADFTDPRIFALIERRRALPGENA
jgi:beta-phosphoglucomutase